MRTALLTTGLCLLILTGIPNAMAGAYVLDRERGEWAGGTIVYYPKRDECRVIIDSCPELEGDVIFTFDINEIRNGFTGTVRVNFANVGGGAVRSEFFYMCEFEYNGFHYGCTENTDTWISQDLESGTDVVRFILRQGTPTDWSMNFIATTY